MRIITVNLPVSFLQMIDTMIGEHGAYPSRSELIRVAVREFLIKELETAEKCGNFTILKPKPVDIDPSLFVHVPSVETVCRMENGFKTYHIVKKEGRIE